MSSTVWVLHLPDDANIKVESGQQVRQKEILAEAKDKDFESPTKAKISEIKDNKIKLKFSTLKIQGKGDGQDIVWGELAVYDQLGLTDINCNLAGELIFISKLSNLVLKKGSVVGIAGFVAYEREKKVNNLEVPVLVIDEEDKKKLDEHEGKNCLLHASKNCLLIPKDEN